MEKPKQISEGIEVDPRDFAVLEDYVPPDPAMMEDLEDEDEESEKDSFDQIEVPDKEALDKDLEQKDDFKQEQDPPFYLRPMLSLQSSNGYASNSHHQNSQLDQCQFHKG